MSFMPDTGTVVRLLDGRVCALTGFTRSSDDRVVFPDGREEQITAWNIEALLTGEEPVGRNPRDELAKNLSASGKA